MAGTRDDSFFQQKGKGWFNKPFYNNILSTNIAVWRYLADSFFDGDLTRIVWSSPDMMFRIRQQQVAAYKQKGEVDKNVELMPVQAFQQVEQLVIRVMLPIQPPHALITA